VQIGNKESAHEHTGSAEAIRPSLRNGFNAYSVISPVNGSFATVALRLLARLDTSTAMSGPHAFAVRFGIVRPGADCARDTLASTASHPTYRDDREPPLLSERDA